MNNCELTIVYTYILCPTRKFNQVVTAISITEVTIAAPNTHKTIKKNTYKHNTYLFLPKFAG